MFGEGRHEEILDTGDLELAYGFLGTDAAENSCFMCYSVLIDEDEFVGEEKISAGELMTTFIEEDHRKIEGLKYVNYIQGVKGDGTPDNSRGPGRVLLLTDIEPGKAYGINFVAKNKESGYSLIEAAGQTLAVAGGIVLTGSLGTLTASCFSAGEAATFGAATPICIALGGATTASWVTTASFLGMAGDNINGVFSDSAERDTSIIYIDTLEESQKRCYSGDLAGQ